MKPSAGKWLQSVFRAGAAGEHLDWASVEWYAQDRYSRLGVFESVGQPIPRATFRDLDAYLTVQEALYQLPRLTAAAVLVEGTRRQKAWCSELAERGLFVFDSWEGRDWEKGYRLLAYPEVPLSVEQLPEPLQPWFARLRLKRVEFALARQQPLNLSGTDME